MSLFAELQKRREEILKLAAECGLKDVRVFGSVAREEEDEESDVDILIMPDAHASLFDFARFQIRLEALLHMPVDVVSERELHPLIRERILKDAQPV